MFSILSIIISTLICNSSYFFNNDVTLSIGNSTQEYNISSMFSEYCSNHIEEYNHIYDNDEEEVEVEDDEVVTVTDEFEIVMNNNYSVENITNENDDEVEVEIEVQVEEEVEIEVEQVVNTTE